MDFPLDANGRYVEIHNVDHLALMLIGPTNLLWRDMPITNGRHDPARGRDCSGALAKAHRPRRHRRLSRCVRGPRMAADCVTVRYRNLRDMDPSNPYKTVEIG